MMWQDHSRKYCASLEEGLAIAASPTALSIFTMGAQAALNRANSQTPIYGPLRITSVKVEETPGEHCPWAVYVKHAADALVKEAA